MSPKAGPDVFEEQKNLSPLPVIEPRIIQPIYEDTCYAIPVPTVRQLRTENYIHSCTCSDGDNRVISIQVAERQ